MSRLDLGDTSQNWPLKYLFPLAALLTLIMCVHERHTFFRDRVVRVFIAFGLAGFVGCFPRPDMVHIAFAAPLVFPLLLYCITRITISWPKKYQLLSWHILSRLLFLPLFHFIGLPTRR